MAILITPLAVSDEPDRIFEFCDGARLRLEANIDKGVGAYSLAIRIKDEWHVFGNALFDSEQRLMRQENTDQTTVVFEPHSCEKVPGICEYTKIADEELRQSLRRVNSLHGNEWRYSLFDMTTGKPDLLRVGIVEYAPDGFVLQETWTEIKDLKESCWRRIPSDTNLR